MKTTKVLLLSLGMALCVGGGIGAAVAITRNSAGNTGSGDFDKVISLCWGSGESSATLDNITELDNTAPVYRYLAVTPSSSKSVAGTVTVSFELAASDVSHDIVGLTVSVYKTASLADDTTVATLIDGVTAEPVLTKASANGSTSFTVSAGESAHETNAYYAIEVSYDGSSQGSLEFGGQLTISQAFAA